MLILRSLTAQTRFLRRQKDLDMGFMSYVACFHTFGKLQDTPWEKHEQMINVNVMTILEIVSIIIWEFFD